MRLRRGHSPFLGSRDHFALRLEIMGFSRRRIVSMTSAVTLMLSVFAWLITQMPLDWGVVIVGVLAAEFLLVGAAISKIKI